MTSQDVDNLIRKTAKELVAKELHNDLAEVDVCDYETWLADKKDNESYYMIDPEVMGTSIDNGVVKVYVEVNVKISSVLARMQKDAVDESL